MSCPRDFSGQPLCHITAHPHHPHQYFCSTCNKPIRFTDRPDSSEWFWLLIILGVIVLVLLAGCEKQADRLLIQIRDSSSSALQKAEQSKLR